MGSLSRNIVRAACVAVLFGSAACTGARRQLYVDYSEPTRRLRSPVSLNIASEQGDEVANQLQFELAVSPPRDTAVLVLFATTVLSRLDSVLSPEGLASLRRHLGGDSVAPRAIEVNAERGDTALLERLILASATIRPPLTVARSVGPDRGRKLPLEEPVAWCIVGPEIRARMVLRGVLSAYHAVPDERYTVSVRWIAIPVETAVPTRCRPSSVTYASSGYGLSHEQGSSIGAGASVDSLVAAARMIRYNYLTIVGLGLMLVTGIFTIAGS